MWLKNLIAALQANAFLTEPGTSRRNNRGTSFAKPKRGSGLAHAIPRTGRFLQPPLLSVRPGQKTRLPLLSRRKLEPEVLNDAIFGAIYYRMLLRSGPMTRRFGEELVDQVIGGHHSGTAVSDENRGHTKFLRRSESSRRFRDSRLGILCGLLLRRRLALRLH